MTDKDQTPPEFESSPLSDADPPKPADATMPQGLGDAPPNLDQHDGHKILTPEEQSRLPKPTEKRKILPKVNKNLDDPRDSKITKPDDENEKVTKNQKSNLFIWPIIISVLVGLVAIYLSNRQLPAASEQAQLISYQAELEKMQAKYINQTDRFWTTFLASLEPILNTDDPDVPAVIMLTVPDGHHHMALCFAQHLAEVLNKLLGGKNPEYSLPSYVDGTKLSSLDADTQKERMDKKIEKIVESKQKTVIINRLEKLHPQSVRFFHGICDNSEAKYKDIAVIFILEVPEESNFADDREVYVYLYKLWNQLEPGTIKALLARMANNVAIMQKVNHFIC